MSYFKVFFNKKVLLIIVLKNLRNIQIYVKPGWFYAIIQHLNDFYGGNVEFNKIIVFE